MVFFRVPIFSTVTFWLRLNVIKWNQSYDGFNPSGRDAPFPIIVTHQIP